MLSLNGTAAIFLAQPFEIPLYNLHEVLGVLVCSDFKYYKIIHENIRSVGVF
jgi:hypothetical protein